MDCEQISGVVLLFSYPLRTALAVGLSMAQIGEFAFVLLSAAGQLGMLPYQVYMLLMGGCSNLLHSSFPEVPCHPSPDVRANQAGCQPSALDLSNIQGAVQSRL